MQKTTVKISFIKLNHYHGQTQLNIQNGRRRSELMELGSAFDGLFDEYPEGEPNPLLIDVFDDESDDQSKSINSTTNIYRPVNGGTELHRAIRSGDQARIDGLLDVYQQDFNKVRDYLMRKYRCDPNDRIWLQKSILVAEDEDQCTSVKLFERNSTVSGDLTQAVFVLLLSPIDDEQVAVLHPKHSNPLELFGIIRKLLPNGLLTWNNVELNGQCQTFVQAAAARGNNNAIARLFNLGAQLSPPNHNPLLAACSSLRKDTIHYLLRDHFDDFDCTQRNNHTNAVMILMQKNDTEMLDFVLEKMIHYRRKQYQESKSQAFNNIFRYENDEHASISILTYVRPGPMRSKIESYIVEYELDLSYQGEDTSMLAELMHYELALEYCRNGIQKNPELLGLKAYRESTVLHECIISEMLDFLKEIYVRKPEVKKCFETDRGFTLLQEALENNFQEKVAFMLENHKEFFLSDYGKLKEVVLNDYCFSNFYTRNGALLSQHFPKLKEDIVDRMEKEREGQITEDHEKEYRALTEKLQNDPTAITIFQHLLSNIRGPKGETVLHYAVETDNLTLYEKLLKVGCDQDSLDNDGNHPVHFVRSTAMLDLIIQNHPEGRSLVHRTNFSGYSLLHKACSLHMDPKSLIELLGKIFEHGADVNQLTNNGESAAFMTSYPAVLQVLINHNIHLEAVTSEGETVLQRHLCYQNARMARKLLPLLRMLPVFRDHAHKYLAPLVKAKRYIFDYNYRPFLEANPDMTKLISDSVYEHSREEASQLFTLACIRSRHFFVDKFLQFDYDLDFNLQGEFGYTPIMGLLCNCRDAPGDLFERLLAKGVDLELRNQYDQTVLMMLVARFESARWYGYSPDTVRVLLDHGAMVNAADHDGNTALHLAFQGGQWELIEVLVQHGGDLTVKNRDGKVPCEMGTTLHCETFSFMR